MKSLKSFLFIGGLSLFLGIACSDKSRKDSKVNIDGLWVNIDSVDSDTGDLDKSINMIFVKSGYMYDINIENAKSIFYKQTMKDINKSLMEEDINEKELYNIRNIKSDVDINQLKEANKVDIELSHMVERMEARKFRILSGYEQKKIEGYKIKSDSEKVAKMYKNLDRIIIDNDEKMNILKLYSDNHLYDTDQVFYTDESYVKISSKKHAKLYSLMEEGITGLLDDYLKEVNEFVIAQEQLYIEKRKNEILNKKTNYIAQNEWSLDKIECLDYNDIKKEFLPDELSFPDQTIFKDSDNSVPPYKEIFIVKKLIFKDPVFEKNNSLEIVNISSNGVEDKKEVEARFYTRGDRIKIYVKNVRQVSTDNMIIGLMGELKLSENRKQLSILETRPSVYNSCTHFYSLVE